MVDFNKYKNYGNMPKKKYEERSFSYEQLINYYPKQHLLDELLTANPNCDHINFFMDLKNIMQTVYLEFAVRYMINDSKEKGSVSSWIFESFIAYIGFHKDYVMSRGKTCNFYVFFETGDSGYHKRLDKRYKANRSIDKAFGLEEHEMRFNREIWQKNLILIEKAGSKLPDVTVFHMKNLEADFIPYYLMSRNKVNMSENVLNITYSTDHDLYQNTLVGDKSYTYWRRRQEFKIFDKHKIVKNFSGDKKTMKEFADCKYYPLLIAMCGDPGDNVAIPIKRAGVVRINKIVAEFAEICGGMEKIYETASNLSNDKLIPDELVNTLNIENTLLRRFVEENDKVLLNLRLMSFEVLSRVLDNAPTGTMIESRKHIDEMLNNKKTAQMQPLVESLAKIKVYPEEKHLMKVYLNTESSFDQVMASF
jgi:hypothetical protein